MVKKSKAKESVVDKTKKVTALQIVSRTALCAIALGIVYVANFLGNLIDSYVAVAPFIHTLRLANRV